MTHPWPPWIQIIQAIDSFLLEVRVVEDDVGRLATQLQEEPLERGGALLHDPAGPRPSIR